MAAIAAWLSYLEQHPDAFRVDAWSQTQVRTWKGREGTPVGEGAAVGSVGSRGGGCGEATLASIKLFFELERQQELVRRKISSLQRLMQCKLFVGQVCNDPRAHYAQLHTTLSLYSPTPIPSVSIQAHAGASRSRITCACTPRT